MFKNVFSVLHYDKSKEAIYKESKISESNKITSLRKRPPISCLGSLSQNIA